MLSIWPGFAYNNGMIRIQLDNTTRDDLQALRRQDLPAKARDRLEMILLADAGWPAARIAGQGVLVARASDLPSHGLVVHVAPEGATAVTEILEAARVSAETHARVPLAPRRP